MPQWEQDTLIKTAPEKWLADPLISKNELTEPSFQENPEEAQAKAKSNLDTAVENNVPLDIVDSGVFNFVGNMTTDPLEYNPLPEGKGTLGIEEFEIAKQTARLMLTNPISRVVWKGLGILGWPFERTENLIAGPIRPVTKESARRASLTIQYIMDKANGLEPSDESKEAVELQHFFQYIREHAIPAYKEAAKAVVPAVKALNPWSKVPSQDLKTFTDVYRGYWMGWMNDEPPPEWIAQPTGLATSFVVTPYVVGKVFKGLGKLGKSTSVYKAIQEYRIPKYQQAKQLTRLETGAKIYDASELGKSISQKDLTEITQQISAKIGKPISESAVQQRIIQIIKGGITEQPALQAKANAIIDEFRVNAKILREHGILSDYTYTTKLTKAQVAGIRNKIETAGQEISRLQSKVPYKEKLVSLAQNVDMTGREKLADDIFDLATDINISKDKSKFVKRLGEILNINTTQPKKLEALVVRAKKASETERSGIIDELFDLWGEPEKIKMVGLKPLFKEIQSMTYRFPGKAAKLRELQEGIASNLDRLYTNEIYGGTNYFPRMYLTKEAEQAAKRFPFWSSHRIRAMYAKAREKIPFEVRKEMGEIYTEYPVVKRLIQQGVDIELAKHYRQIVQTPGWTSRVAADGFKMLPEDKVYGELAGKFVKSVIYNDLKDMHRIKSNLEVIYDTAIGSWKAAVTIWSPSLHFRNMWSNSILLDLSGVGHAEQAKLIVQSIKEISNNSDDYQQARRYLSRGTFSQAELLDDLLAGTKKAEGTGIQKSINFVAGMSKKISSVPSDIYGKEEFAAKFIKFLSERNKGKDIITAAQEANKWLFDYGDLSSFEKNVMRRIMPFYTFPSKAIPRVMESIAQKPHTIAKYAILHWAMEKYSLHRLQLTEDDYAQIKKTMPDYMKNGSYMLMPYRDSNNDLRFFDLTYLLPWGQISDFQQRGALNVIISNPMLQVVGDIQRNKDSFAGRKIWEDTDTEEEKFTKKVLHFWQSAAPLPPWFPGGRYYDKIYEAVTGKPSKKWDILLEKKPSLPETLLHTLGGLRLAPVDVGKQAMFYWQDKQQKIIELEKKISDSFIQQSAGNISQEQLRELREQYMQQMVDLVSED